MGLVSVDICVNSKHSFSIDDLNSALMEAARQKFGATHVFGIEYMLWGPGKQDFYNSIDVAYGDAYKPRK